MRPRAFIEMNSFFINASLALLVLSAIILVAMKGSKDEVVPDQAVNASQMQIWIVDEHPHPEKGDITTSPLR